MRKNVLGAGVSQHIDAGVARNFLRPITPENDFPVQVKNANADLQAIEDVAIDRGIVKGRHGGTQLECYVSIGEEAF